MATSVIQLMKKSCQQSVVLAPLKTHRQLQYHLNLIQSFEPVSATIFIKNSIPNDRQKSVHLYEISC